MDLRDLNPEEAHAVRQNVLELRRQNLDAELRGDVIQNETKGQQWRLYLLQRLILVGAAITILSTAFVSGVFYGVIKSSKFAYQNRHNIHGTFTVVVESTYNAAKRRLVTVSGLVSVPRRIRPNLRPPSPRRRNGIIRQPPMTSNLARWEDELRARREEEFLMAMQGVESETAGVSDYMMSGAIMDLADGHSINPHYNPLYTPLPIDTTALDACVKDIVDQNASPISFATNRNDGEDGDAYMGDPEEFTAQQHVETVRRGFIDFFPPHLVESRDSGSENQITSTGGPGSTNIANVNNTNAIASRSSKPTTHNPANTFTSLSPKIGSSTSVPASAIGAIDSHASGFAEPLVESIIPKPQQQLSIGSTKNESLISTRVDDTYSDLSDDTEQQELPLCDFQGDIEESIFMEIYRATSANMKLRSDDSIASDEGTESPRAQAKTSDNLEPIALPEAILASYANSQRESKALQLSQTAVDISTENTEELIPLSSPTHQIQTESQEIQVSRSLRPVPVEIHEEKMDLPSIATPVQRKSHQTLSMSATTPLKAESQEDPRSPGSSDEDEEAQQLFSRSSHFEIAEKYPPSALPTASLGHHGTSPLRFTPSHGFEQENFPLLSEQLDNSIPISSVQILEQKSSGQTTPTNNHGQQSPLSSVSPMRLPGLQSSLPSLAQSDISLPATSIPDRKQCSPKSNLNTPKRNAKKSVVFFQSPKTGRPITKTKKYIMGEPMDFPVSSSPALNSVASTESSILEFNSPTTIAETEVLVDSFAQHDPNTAISPHYLAEKAGPEEEGELEIVDLMGENPKPAGILTSEIRNDTGTMLEVTRSVESSLEADTPAHEQQSTEIKADGSLIELDKRFVEADKSTAQDIGTLLTGSSSVVGPNEPVIETELRELTVDNSSKEADKLSTREGSPGGSLLAVAEKPMADMKEDIYSTIPDDSSLVKADTLVIEKDLTQETAGSSLGEADEPAEEEDVATNRDEAIAKTSGNFSLRQLYDTTKLARPESSRRRTSPNRHSVQPARKSLRLQNKSAKMSPPRPAKIAEKLTVLDLSGGYGTTATSSKHYRKVLKAEQARVKQAAIEAVEKALRLRKEAEEAKEKARKEKEEEEERQRKTTRRIPKEKVIQPLTAEWEALVQAAMDTPDMRTVLVTLPSGTKLTRKDFGTLKVVPGRDPSHGWLNDEIILASLQQVVDYGLRMSNHETGKTPKYHAFNTFFYKNLRDKGAQSIKRWATKAKIGGRALEEVERVFIPVHQGAHWTLLVVSPVARTIEYFDSMGGPADSYIRNAKLWLATEMGARFKENEWAVPTGTHGEGPRQTNMSDCGVFTCTTARMVALGIDPMAYGGEDMGVQRGRMVAELLNGGLFGDFDPKVEF